MRRGRPCSPGPHTPLNRPLTKPGDQIPQVRWPRAVHAKQRLLHLQGVAHAAAQGVVHSRKSGCNPKTQARPYTNLREAVWCVPCGASCSLRVTKLQLVLHPWLPE